MPCPCPCAYMLQCAEISNTPPPSQNNDTLSHLSPLLPSPPNAIPPPVLCPGYPPPTPINAPPSPPLPLQKKPCVSPNSSLSPTSTPTDRTLSHSSPNSHPPRGAGQSFADRSDRSACSCRRARTSAGIRCRRGDLSPTQTVSQQTIRRGRGGEGRAYRNASPSGWSRRPCKSRTGTR